MNFYTYVFAFTLPTSTELICKQNNIQNTKIPAPLNGLYLVLYKYYVV